MEYAKFDGEDKILEPSEYNLPLPNPFPLKLEKITGVITDIKCVLSKGPFEADFYPMLEELYRSGNINKSYKQEIGAIAMGLVGHGASAINAIEDGPEYQLAMYITASIGDKKIQGWIGFSKFNEGDEVEVVCSRRKGTGVYDVYAILRPKDHVISIYPECLWGRKAIGKQVLKWCLIVTIVLCVFMYSLLYFLSNPRNFEDSSFFDSLFGEVGGVSLLASFFIIGYASFGIYRKMKKGNIFLAEKIYKSLGWKNIENIRLRKIHERMIIKLKKKGEFPELWRAEKDLGIVPTPDEAYYWTNFFYYDPAVVYGRKEK